jgi:hypothetical protein
MRLLSLGEGDARALQSRIGQTATPQSGSAKAQLWNRSSWAAKLIRYQPGTRGRAARQ